MPIPREHSLHLQKQLARHQDALAQARQQQIRLDTEVAVHKFILNTANNVRVRTLLDALADDTQLFAQLERDPASVLEEYQISIPDWVTVRVVNGRQAVRAEFSVHGTRFYAEWDAEHGFDAREDEVR